MVNGPNSANSSIETNTLDELNETLKQIMLTEPEAPQKKRYVLLVPEGYPEGELKALVEQYEALSNNKHQEDLAQYTNARNEFNRKKAAIENEIHTQQIAEANVGYRPTRDHILKDIEGFKPPPFGFPALLQSVIDSRNKTYIESLQNTVPTDEKVQAVSTVKKEKCRF